MPAHRRIGRVGKLLCSFILCLLPIGPPAPEVEPSDPLVRARIHECLAAVEGDNSPATLRDLAHAYQANGFLRESVECYARILELAPQDGESWYLLAVTRHDLGEYDDSLRAARRAAEIAPDYAPLFWRQGLWLLQAGHIDEAKAMFEHALAVDPNAAAARFGLAKIAIVRRDADETERLLSPLMTGSRLRYAHQLMSAVYRLGGDFERAAISMSIGRGAKPEWDDPWLARVMQQCTGRSAMMERVNALARAGSDNDALSLIGKAMELWPGDVTVLNTLGYVHALAGRREMALETWHKALAIDPGHYLIHLNLGTAYAEEAVGTEGSPERALDHLNRAIESNPTHARSHEVMGNLLAATGRMADAVASLERAFDLDPVNPHLARLLTQVYLRQHEWPRAEHVLQRWVRIEPHSAQAHLSLAISLMHMDLFDEAAASLERGAAIVGAEHPQVKALRAELERLRQ